MPYLQARCDCSADNSRITVLADRVFPSAELLGWFEGRERWSTVMRLRGDAEIHGSAARFWSPPPE